MARRNNLMTGNGQANDDLNSTQQRRPHRVPSMSGGNSAYNGVGDDDGQQSVYSMRSNPFYPSSGQSYIQKLNEEKKNDHERRVQQIEEWGFQNEETKKIFEARMLRQQQLKTKKKKLTAQEKYQKIIAQKEMVERRK